MEGFFVNSHRTTLSGSELMVNGDWIAGSRVCGTEDVLHFDEADCSIVLEYVTRVFAKMRAEQLNVN